MNPNYPRAMRSPMRKKYKIVFRMKTTFTISKDPLCSISSMKVEMKGLSNYIKRSWKPGNT